MADTLLTLLSGAGIYSWRKRIRLELSKKEPVASAGTLFYWKIINITPASKIVYFNVYFNARQLARQLARPRAPSATRMECADKYILTY